MITFKPVVYSHQKRKDGTYNVKVRVTFRSVHRHLPTTLYATSAQLTRSLNLKDPALIASANDICDRMREVIARLSPFDLEGRDCDWVVNYIKAALTAGTFRLDFFEFADTYIGCKTDTTRRLYLTALNAFERFLGKRTVDVNSITRAQLLEFKEHVDNEPRQHWVDGHTVNSGKKKASGGASNRYLAKLAHIYNAAKDKYNDEDSGRVLIPRSPFNGTVTSLPPARGQQSLGKEIIQKIISAEVSQPRMRIALDAFIASFGLFGANLADLYVMDAKVAETWVYSRQKTASRRADGAQVRVNIPEQIRPFLERLGAGTDATYYLPALRSMGNDTAKAGQTVNKWLRKWCKLEGVEVFTFYAARHSFATIARSIGVEKATIDDALAHRGDYAITDIYAERDWDAANEANGRLLSIFEW